MKLNHAVEGSGRSVVQVAAAIEPPSFAAPAVIVPTAAIARPRRAVVVLAGVAALELVVIATCSVLIATRETAGYARSTIAKVVEPMPPAVATAPPRPSAAPVAIAAAPEPPPPEPIAGPPPSKAVPSKASPLVRHSPSIKLAEPAAPSPARAACDEISCIADATGWCCPRLLATPAAPSTIDAHAVGTAMAQIRDRAMACRAMSGAKGKVRVHLTVDPDGHIANAAIESTPDAALGECVLHAAHAARFKRTDRGGSFAYSFVF